MMNLILNAKRTTQLLLWSTSSILLSCIDEPHFSIASNDSGSEEQVSNNLFLPDNYCYPTQHSQSRSGTISVVAGPNSSLDWFKPEGAVGRDNTYASVENIEFCVDNSTHFLVMKSMGFTIPADATITGILVQIQKHRKMLTECVCIGTQFFTDQALFLYSPSTGSSNNYAIIEDWPTYDKWFNYGECIDLWGKQWTPQDINSADFSVWFAAVDQSCIEWQENETMIGYVGHISVTVYYY